jgi:hypothetical protein
MSTAHAVPTLLLDYGSSGTILVTDGSGLDSAPISGVVNYSAFGFAGWSASVTTGITKPDQGSQSYPVMHLNTVEASSSAAGTLTLYFSEWDFTSSGGALGFLTSLGGFSANGSVLYETYWAAGNVALNQANLASLTLSTNKLGSLTGGPGSFSGDQWGVILSAPSQYTLTQKVVITHASAGTTSLDAHLTVPDGGATLALLGMSLIGICVLKRKMSA